MSDSIKPSESVVATKLADGQTALLDLKTASYLRLNRTGAFIWSRMEAGMGEADIAVALTEAFDVGTKRATEAVGRFVAELRGAGLLA